MTEVSIEPDEEGPQPAAADEIDEGPLAETLPAPEASPASTPPHDRGLEVRWTLPACLLAWLVPGSGHLLVGRRARAVGFGLLIAALFFAGLALDGKAYRPVSGDPLSYLAAFGASGVGGMYIAAHAFGLGEGDVSAPYHEYGNTFTLVAGLLNLLVILDAFDFAVLRARRGRREGEGSSTPA